MTASEEDIKSSIYPYSNSIQNVITSHTVTVLEGEKSIGIQG